MFKRCVLALLGAIVIVAIIPMSNIASAQDQGSYTGGDIIFIIDQSGSMGGSDYGSRDHPKANDVNGLRFAGTPHAIEILGRRLLENDPDHRYAFRVGVVYFGDRAETVNFGQPDAPLDFVTIKPESEDDWKAFFEDAQQRLSSTGWKGKNLGNTNFLQAFQKARELLTRMEKADSSRRLKAIVMITDGWPVVFTTPDKQVSIGSHMERVQEYIDQNLPDSAYQIYVLGLIDSDNNYWPTVERYWQAATHDHARKTDNNDQFFADVQVVLNDIIHPLELGADDELIRCGPTFVPPYLSLVRFTFHKARASNHVQVFTPDNKLIGTDSAVIRGGESPIETVTIEEPQPGTWRLECPQGVTIPPKIFKRGVQVTATPDTSILHQFIPARVEYRLTYQKGDVVKEYNNPRYPLQVQLQMVHSSETITPSIVKVEDGRYSADIQPAFTGEYQLRLIGSSFGITSTQRITVFESILPIVVRPTLPRIVAPDNDVTQLVPTTVTVALVDDQEQPIPVTKDSSLQIEALLAKNDDQQAITLSLKTDGAYGNLFSGRFTPQYQGEYTAQLSAQIETLHHGEFTTFADASYRIQVNSVVAQLMEIEQSPLQHVPLRLAYKLMDRAGNSLNEVLAPGYSLSATARIEAGGSAWTLPLNPQSGGVFDASFRPTIAQPHTVHLIVKAIHPQRHEAVLLDDDQSVFEVKPTTLVEFAITRPTNGTQSEWRTFYFSPNPLMVEIELRNDRDEIVDPQLVMPDPQVNPFEVSIRTPDGQVKPVDSIWESTDKTGQYRLSISGLDMPGWYDVEVKANQGALKIDHVFNVSFRSVRVERADNHLLGLASRAIMPLGLFSGLLLLMYVVLWLRQQGVFTKQLLKGRIQIEGSSFNRVLPGRRVVFYGRKDLAGTGLKYIKAQAQIGGALVSTRQEGGPLFIRSIWLRLVVSVVIGTSVGILIGMTLEPSAGVVIGPIFGLLCGILLRLADERLGFPPHSGLMTSGQKVNVGKGGMLSYTIDSGSGNYSTSGSFSNWRTQ